MDGLLIRLLQRLTTIGVTAIALSMMSGCSSTDRQQKEAELAVLDAALSESKALLADLKAGRLPPQFDVHLYLGLDILNRALAGLDGFQFPLPNDPTVTVKVGKVRVANVGVLPSVSVAAAAARGDLNADVEITGVLTPKRNATMPGIFEIRVLSFTPKVSWLWLELTKFGFVRSLLAAELAKVTARLPTIQLPVSQAVTLGAPGRSEIVQANTGRDSWLKLKIDVPDTKRDRKLVISRYVFVGKGIHVFGGLQ
jgi:hypothetical protein